MAVRGADQVRRRMRQTFARIAGDQAQRALTEALIVAEAHAASMTPQHHGTLLQSMYRDIRPSTRGYTGRVGYTAEYAARVHDASGALAGQPRPGVGQGDYWDPSGEPGFLVKAFEGQGKKDIKDAIVRAMKI